MHLGGENWPFLLKISMSFKYISIAIGQERIVNCRAKNEPESFVLRDSVLLRAGTLKEGRRTLKNGELQNELAGIFSILGIAIRSLK